MYRKVRRRTEKQSRVVLTAVGETLTQGFLARRRNRGGAIHTHTTRRGGGGEREQQVTLPSSRIPPVFQARGVESEWNASSPSGFLWRVLKKMFFFRKSFFVSSSSSSFSDPHISTHTATTPLFPIFPLGRKNILNNNNNSSRSSCCCCCLPLHMPIAQRFLKGTPLTFVNEPYGYRFATHTHT